MEIKYAAADKTSLNSNFASQNKNETSFYKEYTKYLKDFVGLSSLNLHKQCIGFCYVPKYILFSNHTLTTDTEMSCSMYIIEYLVNFIDNFGNYCMWHTKICFLQLILCSI